MTPPDDDVIGAPDQPRSVLRAAALGRSRPVLACTPLGTIDAGAIADVDPSGLLQLRGATWSLDWWIGAEDRWHHPAREAAVRQRPLDDVPVVETSMRVPGGDVVHRAFGVRATSVADPDTTWDDSGVIVEIENLTAVPVALALVVRPLGLDGAGAVGSVTVEGTVVRVDGRVSAVLSRPPARMAQGPCGQPAELLATGRDEAPDAAIPTTDDASIEVALVVPLPHTATVRVLLPRVDRSSRRWFAPAARNEPGSEFAAPATDSIVSGWGVHGRDLARVELPEPMFDRVLAGSLRSLALAAGDGFLDRGPGDGADGGTRATSVCETLARSGSFEPLGPLARALVDAQRLNGQVRAADGSDATDALLFAAAPLLATGATGWEELLLGPVAKALHRRRRNAAPTGPGSCSSAAAGMLEAPLRGIGQPEVADEAAACAASMDPAVERPSPGAPAVVDLVGRVAEVRERLRRGDGAALGALADLARLGTPGAAGDRYDSQGDPSGTSGFDPAAVAARAAAVLDVVVGDAVDGPRFLPVWSTTWWGRPAEAHGVRSRHGRVSFALRWHGERPAILWEIEPPAGSDPASPGPVVAAPGLDPAWSARGWTGEALLAPVQRPADLTTDLTTDPEASSGAPTGAPRVATSDPAPPPAEGQSFS